MVAPPNRTTLRVGISTCLLGEAVRYDGGHKRDAYLTDTLGSYVEWVSICPEVEIGLGTPREAIRLEGSVDDPRLIGRTSRTDLTARMTSWADARARRLSDEGLDGYVLKSDSPSCGLERVRVHAEQGPPNRSGRGLWATALTTHVPDLPTEEEGRLRDPILRENFITRLFAYHRLRTGLVPPVSTRTLMEFHASTKIQLMSHDPAAYRDLGRLVAAQRGRVPAGVITQYRLRVMEALTKRATRAKNANALSHLQGLLKRDIDAGDRGELADLIETYRRGEVPLIVPITLLKHHFRTHPVAWALEQTFLNPYPEELMLRNHV